MYYLLLIFVNFEFLYQTFSSVNKTLLDLDLCSLSRHSVHFSLYLKICALLRLGCKEDDRESFSGGNSFS